MSSDASTYRLEDVLSSFYRVEKIKKINYHQYISKAQNDQWSIQMEFMLRKQDPKTLVALLSRDLWCFSINDDPVPTPPAIEHKPVSPDKIGTFTADYSKPNLPPHYALFLKALRRKIYINLALGSHNKLIQFGNACISLSGVPNYLVQLEPHLFVNGDLTVSLCAKNMGLVPMKEENLEESFLSKHALYLAPSGIRMHLAPASKQGYLITPPKHTELLLTTLSVSHGINLQNKKNLKWVAVVPDLGHLNGHTPTIASYLTPLLEAKKLVWPLHLIFAQPVADIENSTSGDPSEFHCLQDALDAIDDFIQLKQTAAYRTPGSSGVLSSNIAGTNPLSSDGAYTEQFQHYKNNSISSQPASYHSVQETNKISPKDFSPNFTGIDKLMLSPSDQFAPAFLNTPNNNINENELFNDRKQTTVSNDLENSPLKTELEANGRSLEKVNNSVSKTGSVDTLHNKEGTLEQREQNENLPSDKSDSMVDKELFGEDEDEDLFGDSNKSNSTNESNKSISDEITEDMFEMSDEEENNNNKSINKNNKEMHTDLGKDIPFFPSSEKPNIRTMSGTTKRLNGKRKYLDIPIDEMTLPTSPLYMDPGAPLPVETPRDRRKSVFAPLNFNPIIENNVDNKYKSGGKFSFSPLQKEEALNFDISMADLSSSEEEEDEEENGSSDEDLKSLNVRDDMKPSDNISTNTNIHEPQYINYSSIPSLQDSIIKQENFNSVNDANITSNKEGFNSIWKIPQNDIPQTESPLKTVDSSIQPIESNIKMTLEDNNVTSNPSEFTPNMVSSEISNLPKDKSGIPEFTPADPNLSFESSSSLPFLLRHMPLASIPDIFITPTPVVTISEKEQDILDLIAEQVVTDYNILGNLGIPKIAYRGVKDCQEGLITTTMLQLFSTFDRLNGNDTISKFYNMKQPYVFVKKHHELIKVKHDSQPFIKFLNFRPPNGIKNFKSLLLSSSFKEDCLSFAPTLSQTYINQELGFCELLKLTNEDPPGLMYLKAFDKNKLLLLAAQIVSYCSNNKNSIKNVPPILIILPLDNATLTELVDKANIFQVIKNEVCAKMPNIELYLKVIPMDFIRNALVTVDQYVNVAISIYNMLPPKSVKFTHIAHTLPEKVNFRTMQQQQMQQQQQQQQQNNSTGSSSIIYYDSYIHLAYSRSVDKEWVFAALSDSYGQGSMTKTWYVGNSRGKFDDACNQIWNMALNLASKKFGKICLILTRLNGILPDDELMNWRRLSGRNIHLAVVCVDDNSKISFIDEDKLYPSFKPIYKDTRFGGRMDMTRLDDYEIRDIDQDIHGIVFQHPFPLAHSQHRCAIRSGALIKFKKCDGDTVWDKFAVNLLNCPHSDSTQLLETILEEFRNLAALNVWYGLSDGEDGHIPWHILAVKKMMNTLVHTRVKIANTSAATVHTATSSSIILSDK
ncbi:Ssn2p [Saccharomyces cerevisiae YJM1527]|nr:Ssn2p [Saccharomyces cerevisiae YJM320]AJU67330.1 Ssn2p [Saccharomyces cerevisiae YJM456]AJU68745.1 Ssn2p [Saccharomyces cerevisiae YJM541]AJU69437.1 Ssn2p [Saccharomyces cerevisiae YJM554]AJU70152.1 Ssn2p [Saccharomyces cerevisiae YJM555]AJU89600.1 Ssn2p [Saccharomyces cerevisiae YJM1273]AJU94586.1 Ssn2p [Saccharomyces cerevisiae YJM1338]AJV09353.1 Ssn2p [Saccharomyces cerevisiae YJM1434]AJV10759.1 Ssn2p [Saccharomyces cerevisiae YJM1443]AJV17655.1 Ssn2p [Saccharomyces cerevisiae YJM15